MTQGQGHRVVSNSEALTWLRCEREYYYNYDLAIEPVVPPIYFRRGNVVHRAHERYYKAIMAGAGHSEARQAGTEAFSLALEKASFGDDVEHILNARRMMFRYWDEVAVNDNWRILAVEKNYNLPLTEDFSFGFTPDLIAEIDGLITVVDHKNVYDFWKRRELDLDPQSRKYMAALIGLGRSVDRVMHNQTRHRMLKTRMQRTDELFRRDFSIPNPDERRNMLAEQIRVTMKIVKHRSLPLEERKRDVMRTLDKRVCEKCLFAELCYTELRGGIIDTMLEEDFKPNTYVTQYNKESA